VVRPERLHRVDLAARARERAGTGSRPGTMGFSGFALAELLAWRPTAIPLADRSDLFTDVRRHSHAVSDELGHLPRPRARRLRVRFFRLALVLRARVGRGPLATPVHSTDVCNSRFVFQRMTALRLGALRAVFPHAARERSVHAESLTSARQPAPSERCLLRSHRLRVPLTPRRVAGSPAGRDCVRRRRPADRLATILGSYPRAEGFLGHAA
jgi:hypothetical protein